MVVVVEGEEASVENAEAIAVTEEAEEAETSTVDHNVETRDHLLRKCNRASRRSTH